MAWAALDCLLDDLFEPLLECSTSQVASLMTNVESIGSRCEMLKRLAICEIPESEYRSWLIAVLERVRSELAPLRNRYIHDRWSVNDQEIVRTDKRAKVRKDQGIRPASLSYDTKHVADPMEVDRFTHRVHIVMTGLSFARLHLHSWRTRKFPLTLDPLMLPASMQNARYLTPLEHLEVLARKRPRADYVIDKSPP